MNRIAMIAKTPPGRSGLLPVRMSNGVAFVALFLCLAVPANRVLAQTSAPPVQSPREVGGPVSQYTTEARGREKALIAEVRESELTLEVEPRTSKIIRTRRPVARISITRPEVLEVVQFGPTELELIGLMTGETSFTVWFAGADGQEKEMLRYQVRVSVNEGVEDRRKTEYAKLERKINELFPNSFVHLFAVGDKLIIRGQARDSREAGDILTLVRDESPDAVGAGGNRRGDGYGGYGGYGYGGYGYGGYGGIWNNGWGGRSGGWGGRGNGGGTNIVNMLDVPGEKQVVLKVRVAELSRSALRDVGTKLKLNFGDFTLSSNLGTGGAFSAVLSTHDLALTMEALSTNGYSKILAEPNLVTLSGHPAYFIAGGQFAVPTTVGVQGVGAVSTTFQGFGTQVRFTPTVLDKDRIRLQVTPTFSNPTKENTVNGIPGLSTRSVDTTVDLREGQWLAIAGLIQDQQEGSKIRVPFIGDVPYLDFLFSNRHIKRDETELLVLVSPELVHPLEAEEAPLILPGMEVTEPSDCAFFFAGDYEGRSNLNYRSTVSPIVQRQNLNARRGEAKTLPGYQNCENRYIQGPHGFSQ